MLAYGHRGAEIEMWSHVLAACGAAGDTAYWVAIPTLSHGLLFIDNGRKVLALSCCCVKEFESDATRADAFIYSTRITSLLPKHLCHLIQIQAT